MITSIIENKEDIGILKNIDYELIENLTEKELIAFTAEAPKNDDPGYKEKKKEINDSGDEDMGTVDADWDFFDLETDDGFQILENSKLILTNKTENKDDLHKEKFLTITSLKLEKIKVEIEYLSDLEIHKSLKIEKNYKIIEAELSTCEICPKQFKYSYLKKHVQNVHAKVESHCDECGKVYRTERI